MQFTDKPGSATVSVDKTRVLIGDTVNLYCNATDYGMIVFVYLYCLYYGLAHDYCT